MRVPAKAGLEGMFAVLISLAFFVRGKVLGQCGVSVARCHRVWVFVELVGAVWAWPRMAVLLFSFP